MTRGLIRSAAIVGTLTMSSNVGKAQTPAPLAGATLEHVGIAVRNIDTAAKIFAQVFGAAVSAPSTITAEGPGGLATFKVTQLRTANFRIELAQPVGANVFSAWLDKYGDGVQHVGLTVPDKLAARVKALQAMGGAMTLGRADRDFVFVDLTTLIGTTLELTQHSPTDVSRSPEASPISALSLAGSPVQHIGLVVPDIEKTARVFADLLAVPLPRFNVVANPAFPATYTGDPKASVKTITFRLGDVSMEFQQSSPGKNPWNDFGRLHGGAGVEYVAFRMDDNLTPMRRQLESFGGAPTIGNDTVGYSQYDFLRKLGLVIEILGTPKP
jgi:catechol 2,3-dioxygenase-like lactoylglutathione lyase family enzyme